MLQGRGRIGGRRKGIDEDDMDGGSSTSSAEDDEEAQEEMDIELRRQTDEDLGKI